MREGTVMHTQRSAMLIQLTEGIIMHKSHILKCFNRPCARQRGIPVYVITDLLDAHSVLLRQFVEGITMHTQLHERSVVHRQIAD